MDNQMKPIPFAKIGEDVIFWPHTKIVFPEAISIGDNVIIDDFVFLMGGEKTTLGSFIHIGPFSLISGGGKFIMEDFSGVSGGVRIYTGSDDYGGGGMTNPTVPIRYRNVSRSFVHIKKHAIIGANTVILPGVTIGEGAAVGSNSLVTKDCEPWSIYSGSPAKLLRARPKEKIMELEAQLRKELYDAQGRYIPKSKREPKL